MSNIKSISPKVALNRYVNKEGLVRFFPAAIPIYSIDVTVEERTSEPYEMIEKHMEEIIHFTDVTMKDKLYKTMGLNYLRRVGDNILEYLMFINHIDENNESLTLTNIGKESLQLGDKIKVQNSSRILYFDGFSLRPLPKHFYDRKKHKMINHLEINYSSMRIIEYWEDFDLNKIQELLQYKGEERISYNIPQEAVAIRVNDVVYDDELGDNIREGSIVFYPIYLCVYEDKHIEAYSSYSGCREEFFEEIINENIINVKSALYETKEIIDINEIIQPLNNIIFGNGMMEPLNDSIFEFDINSFRRNKNDNFIYELSKKEIDKLIAHDNTVILKRLIENSFTPILDRQVSGRMLYISIGDDEKKAYINYLKEKETSKLRNQGKSQSYIDKEIKNLELRFV